MKRIALVLLVSLLVLGIFGLAGGCAAGKDPLRAEPPAPVAVRVPLAESPDVRFRAEEPGSASPEPFSVADEYRDRWLRVIEIDITPVEEGGPPAVGDSP